MTRAQAIVINGVHTKSNPNAWQHVSDMMVSYFKYEVGCTHTSMLYAGQMSNSDLLIDTHAHLKNAAKDDDVGVVVYIGHGNLAGLEPHALPEETIPYDVIADMFGSIQSPFIFVNAACYSGVCVSNFKKQRALDYGLVIAGAQSNELSQDAFLDAVLDDWRTHRNFRPRTIHHAGIKIIREQYWFPDEDSDREFVDENGDLEIVISSFRPHVRLLMQRDAPSNRSQLPLRVGQNLDEVVFAYNSPQRNTLRRTGVIIESYHR